MIQIVNRSCLDSSCQQTFSDFEPEGLGEIKYGSPQTSSVDSLLARGTERKRERENATEL